MKSGKFTVLWVILGIIVCCLGTVALIYGPTLYREGKALIGPISELSASEKAIEEINAAFPFQPPEDGVIDEERFLAFLEAREELRELYTRWDEDVARAEHEHNDSWQGAKEVLAVTRDVIKAQEEVLRERSMSASEFVWLEDMTYRTWLAEVRKILGKEGHPEATARVEELTQADLQFVEDLAARHGRSGALAAVEERLKQRLDELASRERPEVEDVPAANQELFWKYHLRIENTTLETVGGGIHNRFREPSNVRVDIGASGEPEGVEAAPGVASDS